MNKLRSITLMTLLLISINIIYAINDMPLLAQLQGEHNGSGYGKSILSLDFNHDSYDDIVILAASYGYEYQVSPSRDKVYIYYGGPGFSSTSQPAMTLEGDYPQGMQRKISSIRNAGDVNGDGFDDLMIGDEIPNNSDSERHMIYYGQTTDLLTPDMFIYPQPNEELYQIDNLGDVDGDGFGDLGIYYQIGNVSGFDIQWGGALSRQTIHTGLNIASYPNAITGIGDIDDDGYDDFAIGYAIGGNNISSYTVTIYNGNQDRVYVNPWVLALTTYQITCISKALGDLNADGYDDFLGYVDYQGLKLWLGDD